MDGFFPAMTIVYRFGRSKNYILRVMGWFRWREVLSAPEGVVVVVVAMMMMMMMIMMMMLMMIIICISVKMRLDE